MRALTYRGIGGWKPPTSIAPDDMCVGGAIVAGEGFPRNIYKRGKAFMPSSADANILPLNQWGRMFVGSRGSD